MLNKLKLLFTILFILIVSGCSTNNSLDNSTNHILYNTDVVVDKSEYKAQNVTNKESWNYIYQNTSNKLDNYSYVENNLIFRKISKIALTSKYNTTEITPNFIVNNNVAYNIVNNTLITIDINTCKIINKVKLSFLEKLKNDNVIGLAYKEDNIFITTNKGVVSSFYKDGSESWTINLSYPIQSSPILDNNHIFVIANNTVFSINIFSGEILWQHIGIQNNITISKIIAPTLYQNFIVAGLSNGDVVLLRKENGQLVWSSSISNSRALITSTVIAPPLVVNSGKNILVGSFNNTTLLDAINNKKLWENNNIGFINAPAIINNHIFILDTNKKLNNLDLKTGLSYWSTILPKNSKNLSFINWYGPFLVNGKLLVFNANGNVYTIDPESGKFINSQTLNLGRFDILTGAIAIVNKKIILSSSKYIYIIE